MPNDKKDFRSRLLEEAVRAIAPLIGGCAGVMAGPAEAAVGAAVGMALKSKIGQAMSFVAEKAFECFAPGIVGRWLEWMRGKPRAEQLEAITELGTLPAAEARREAAEAIDQLAPDANPADKEIALEYIAAIPSAAARSLVLDKASGTLTVSHAISPDSRQSLLQLLPTNLPPYQAGTALPGTSYGLEELLGTGGFGAVYKATDPGLQYLKLAIKFCLDPGMVDVLHQERKNLDRLMTAGKGDWSERLVRLYGYNLEHATPFLVYEYVAGGDLASALAVQRQTTGRGFSPEQALEWIVQITQALAFAHERGLVHRDLKPANVLLSGKTIKLADFGIGSVVAAHALVANRIGTVAVNQLTMAEQASLYRGAGTPLYMSPEQRRGEPAEPQQDLFSLGVLWYQLLVGDVTRELHPGWAAELAEEFQTPREHIDLIQRCVGWIKQRPAHAGALLTLVAQLQKAANSLAPEGVGAGLDLGRSSPRQESKDSKAGLPLAPQAVQADKGPRENPAEGPFRKALLVTQLKQLQRCHNEVESVSSKIGGFAVGMVFLAAISGAALVGLFSWAFPDSLTIPHKICLWIVLGIAIFIVLAPLLTRKEQLMKDLAARQLRTKIEELDTDFPEEVRSWGGGSKLNDPEIVQEILALVQGDG
jgi:serine/threonine protein kinase